MILLPADPPSTVSNGRQETETINGFQKRVVVGQQSVCVGVGTTECGESVCRECVCVASEYHGIVHIELECRKYPIG